MEVREWVAFTKRIYQTGLQKEANPKSKDDESLLSIHDLQPEFLSVCQGFRFIQVRVVGYLALFSPGDRNYYGKRPRAKRLELGSSLTFQNFSHQPPTSPGTCNQITHTRKTKRGFYSNALNE